MPSPSQFVFFLGLGDANDDINSEDPPQDTKDPDQEHPLLTDLDHRDTNTKRTHKAQLWFQRDVFKNLIGEKDEDADLDRLVENFRKKGVSVVGEGVADEQSRNNEKDISQQNDVEETSKNVESSEGGGVEYDSSNASNSGDSEDSDYDIEKEAPPSGKASKKNGFEIVGSGGKFQIFIFHRTL